MKRLITPPPPDLGVGKEKTASDARRRAGGYAYGRAGVGLLPEHTGPGEDLA